MDQLPAGTADEILIGDGTGANLPAPDQLNEAQQEALVADTPLWFYILREAEINGDKRLNPLDA